MAASLALRRSSFLAPRSTFARFQPRLLATTPCHATRLALQQTWDTSSSPRIAGVVREFRTSAAVSTPEGDEKTKSKTMQKITALRSKMTSKITHEKVWNLPNTLTFGRLFASPVIGYLILHDQHVAALSLFALAGITDVVDGWIARNYNLQTVVGSVIDPMADKTLMTILTVCLAAKGALPLWCAAIILGRDVALAISAIYFRWISLPPPKTMARYWDFSLPSAEVHPTTISKLNTALQLALIGACMANPLIGNNPDWAAALEAMQYTVATTTIWSGLSYVFSKDAVKILKHPTVPVEQEKEETKMKQ